MTSRLSPSVDERVISRHFAEGADDLALQGLHDAVKQTRELCAKAGQTTEVVLRNTMQTEPAKHRRARDAAFELLQRATKSLDAAVEVGQQEISDIRSRVKGPSPSKDIACVSRQKEIRERLSVLPEDRRKAIITDAIKNDDELLVSAVLSASAWLSNLTDSELALHRHAWSSKHFASDLNRLERLERAVEDTVRAGTLAISYIDNLTDATLVEKAETAEKEATTALALAATK